MDSLNLNLNIQFLLGTSSKKITQINHAKESIIYVCGCYIVFYSPVLDEQIAYIKHKNSNISAITVSEDEKYLAVAQSGKYPSISIYSIEKALSQLSSADLKPQNILKGHKQTIDLIKYSPNGKYIVSISNSDGSMFIWQKGQIITKNKLSKTINIIIFDWNQDLVTIGNGYVKLWKFDKGNAIRKKQGDVWMIEGKIISLGKNFVTKNYIDCGIFQNKQQENNQKLILLSSQGFLCTISHNYQKVQKWIDLMMPNAATLQIYGNLALCGGQNSLIKIIDLVTSSLKGKFPKPPPQKKQNISKDEQLQIKQDQKFPKCIGVMVISSFILTLYENSTIFVWTMDQQIRAFRSIITHNQKINCVCLLEQIHGDITFFATASQDNTLRIWHFYKKCYQNNRESLDIAQIIGIKRNAYCKNLTRIIYTDSQLPIIQMKIFMKKYIVCISTRQFLMYSLQTFQLILYQNFSDQYKSVSFKNPNIVLSLQTSQDLVYLGFQNGFLKIYKPSQQNLLKLKQIDMGQAISNLNLCSQRKIIAQVKSKAILYDFQTNTKNSFNNVIKSSSTQKYVFLAQQKKVIYYSIIKNRKAVQVSLSHEFQADQKIKIIKCNQNLLIILSSKDRLIICNFTATIIYTELMNEQITDIQITSSSQIIMTGRQSDIIIKIINDNSKYKKVQQRAKKWFQLNDMSWMDNSIWASREMNSHSNIKNRLIDQSVGKVNKSETMILGHIDRARSINLDNILGDESIKVGQVPTVQIQYKNQQNKMSIFNPSNIYKQANQIYNNVNGLMKNLGNKQGDEKKNRINFSGDIDQDMFKSQKDVPKQRKGIFKDDQSQYYPKFTNNLVQSQMARIQEDEQSRIQNQKNIQQKIGQSNMVRSRSDNLGSNQRGKQSKTTEGLIHSMDYNQNKQKDQHVNNSLKFSVSQQNRLGNQKNMQIIHTFNQIIQASKFGPQNTDYQYLSSLIKQKSQQFRRIHQVLDKIYGQKQSTKQLQSTQRQTQNSVVPKQIILEQYKKNYQKFLSYLQKSL